jgi:hypothetical protein
MTMPAVNGMSCGSVPRCAPASAQADAAASKVAQPEIQATAVIDDELEAGSWKLATGS